MTFEICADSYVAALIAEKHGVKRIELCSGLSVGGLTPSMGLVKKCVFVSDVETHVMIRHREGDFVYDEEDIRIMSKDILTVANEKVKGVVFGCLTANNEIDIEKSKFLFQFAKERGLEVTFHRAFDHCVDPITALEQLIDTGFDRLLTSGQADTAFNGIEIIEQLVKHATGRIEIMAGSGVNKENAVSISNVGVDALHFTIRDKTENLHSGMGYIGPINEEKVRNIISLFNEVH